MFFIAKVQPARMLSCFDSGKGINILLVCGGLLRRFDKV